MTPSDVRCQLVEALRLAVKHPELLLRNDDIANFLPAIDKAARVPASLCP